MAITINSVGDKLAGTATNTAIYTVAASTSAVITSIIIHPDNATAVDVELTILKAGAGNSIIVFQQDALTQGTAVYLDSKIALETTDVLRITTTVADVSYFVSMIEKT